LGILRGSRKALAHAFRPLSYDAVGELGC
jgi:hypothetical protein